MTHRAWRAALLTCLSIVAVITLTACSVYPAEVTDPLGPDDVVVVVDLYTDSASTMPWSEDIAVEDGKVKLVCREKGISWLLGDIRHMTEERDGRQNAPRGGVWSVGGTRAGDLSRAFRDRHPRACDVEGFNEGQYSQGRAIELAGDELTFGEAGTLICDPQLHGGIVYTHEVGHRVFVYRDPLTSANDDDALHYEGIDSDNFYAYKGTRCDELGLGAEEG